MKPGKTTAPALSAAVVLSLALHAMLLAWIRPVAHAPARAPDFPLQVHLLEQPRPVTAVAAQPSHRAPDRRERMRPTPRLAPALPVPVERDIPPEPVRTRVVADPAEYGQAAGPESRVYAWPGAVREPPYPPEGIPVAYPVAQLDKGEKGLVVVRLELSELGAVENAEFVCATEPFQSAVREALALVRFRPALGDDGLVSTWLLLEFAFLAEPQGRSDADASERALVALQAQCARSRVSYR